MPLASRVWLGLRLLCKIFYCPHLSNCTAECTTLSHTLFSGSLPPLISKTTAAFWQKHSAVHTLLRLLDQLRTAATKLAGTTIFSLLSISIVVPAISDKLHDLPANSLCSYPNANASILLNRSRSAISTPASSVSALLLHATVWQVWFFRQPAFRSLASWRHL
jgi:hypothetical protein